LYSTKTQSATKGTATPPDLNVVFDLMNHAQQAIFFLTFMPSVHGDTSVIAQSVTAALAKPGLLVLGAISDGRALPDDSAPKGAKPAKAKPSTAKKAKTAKKSKKKKTVKKTKKKAKKKKAKKKKGKRTVAMAARASVKKSPKTAKPPVGKGILNPDGSWQKPYFDGSKGQDREYFLGAQEP
jgi:hypothetical protein